MFLSTFVNNLTEQFFYGTKSNIKEQSSEAYEISTWYLFRLFLFPMVLRKATYF